MGKFQTLREGRIQFKVGAEERRLLEELAQQVSKQRHRQDMQASIADVMIPWLKQWCKKPYHVSHVRLNGDSSRVDLRLRYPDDRLCRDFADALEVCGEKNASAVLRAIVHEHIELKRRRLVADARERAGDARERELRKEKAARQREYRAARRSSIADAIELFLAESSARYAVRAAAQLDADGVALAKLGRWLGHHVVAVRQAKARHDSQRAKEYIHRFADRFVRILGFALVQPYQAKRTGAPSQDASLGIRRFE